jgi:hypothetical protein
MRGKGLSNVSDHPKDLRDSPTGQGGQPGGFVLEIEKTREDEREERLGNNFFMMFSRLWPYVAVSTRNL